MSGGVYIWNYILCTKSWIFKTCLPVFNPALKYRLSRESWEFKSMVNNFLVFLRGEMFMSAYSSLFLYQYLLMVMFSKCGCCKH
jgi:hypothetical protein